MTTGSIAAEQLHQDVAETDAITECLSALVPLDNPARARVLAYLDAKLLHPNHLPTGPR